MKFLISIFFHNRFFVIVWSITALFVLGYFIPVIFPVAQLALAVIIIFTIADAIILYSNKKGVFARRETPGRLSNGDNNEIKIYLTNFYSLNLTVEVIDELPFQLQERNFRYPVKLKPGESKAVKYIIRPVKRGEYNFGKINLLVSSSFSLIKRRIRIDEEKDVPVYPSYVQMRKYELLAISDRLTEAGVKKMRRLGHSTEFDQIKEYVKGDDYRTINWKATARKTELMVNHYVEERSQQVYSVIDTGRNMKMPFEGMSLLDYAINASLVISNISMLKQDKAGLITFSNKIHNIIPADRLPVQMNKILEILYKQETGFLEPDFEKLVSTILYKLNQRSLILLFTNFETLNSLKRQLPFLRKLSSFHLLVVIFFQNTELNYLLNKEAKNLREVYYKTIAEKLIHEKRQIKKELELHRINSLYVKPNELSVNVINKYLELKARGMI